MEIVPETVVQVAATPITNSVCAVAVTVGNGPVMVELTTAVTVVVVVSN